MRNIPYWLNIGSILYQYGCATRAAGQLSTAMHVIMHDITIRTRITDNSHSGNSPNAS